MMLGIFAVMAWFGSVIDNLFLTYLIGQYENVVLLSVALTRVFIPGRPGNGRPGIPVILRSRIPGNGAASFPAKTEQCS